MCAPAIGSSDCLDRTRTVSVAVAALPPLAGVGAGDVGAVGDAAAHATVPRSAQTIVNCFSEATASIAPGSLQAGVQCDACAKRANSRQLFGFWLTKGRLTSKRVTDGEGDRHL